MRVKTTSEMIAKPQAVLFDYALTIPPRTTKTITAFIDHPSECNTTGTLTTLEKFTKTVSLLIAQSMSTIFDGSMAKRVTNKTQTPYMIKKHRNCRFLRSHSGTRQVY